MNSDEMSLGSSGTSMTGSKPNILFIMADQLVPFLTEPYGHPVVQMPNLDRLAEEGVTFDAARSPCLRSCARLHADGMLRLEHRRV